MDPKIEDFGILIYRAHDLCVVGLPLVSDEFIEAFFSCVEAVVFGGGELQDFCLP